MPAPPSASNNLDDLMGLGGFGDGINNGGSGFGGTGHDIMDGFAGLNMAENTQPPPAQQQLGLGNASNGALKKTNEDLLGLF